MNNGISNGRFIRSTWGNDKLGIRIDPKVCNTEMKGMYKRQEILKGEDYYGMPGIEGINIINKGPHYYIMYHDILFSDVNKLLIDVVYEGLQKLFNCNNPFIKLCPTGDFMVKYCHFAEIEIFYDFYNFNPVKKVNNFKYNICYGTTIYTPDYYQKLNRDGSVKETFDSIGIIYDKGNKEFSKEERWRIEFRFKKRYLKTLTLQDLCMTTAQLYNSKLKKQIVFYIRKFFKPEYINFDMEKIRYSGSFFEPVYLESLSKNIKIRGAY
ncbi:MAG: hypothetical protein B6226_00735 [Candidatus Cloacimonetes bacterium 4572_65]|nr:MAG: hypothetical protein B6226_00735 [Candidatus Cloacimonetes bacterium 4572_65]